MKVAAFIGNEKDFDGVDIDNGYFCYPVMYQGERHVVFCHTRRDVNSNKFYVHEVWTEDEIKAIPLQTAAKFLNSKPHGGNALYKSILAKFLNNSNIASKVVDENGEPKVVYHGSDADFDVFDSSKGRRGAEYRKRDNIERGAQAVDEVLHTRQDVPKAMFRSETGGIDFVYREDGDPSRKYAGGYEIAHILKKHGQAAVDMIPTVIVKGKASQKYDDRIHFKYAGYVAVVRFNFDGNNKTWLVTNFEKHSNQNHQLNWCFEQAL